MEETYLYSVHPKRPITDLSGVGFLRVPKSLQLTKEDVKKCLEKAVVYRRFANEGGKEVRVTINDIDRLHNAKYMTEEEYKEFLANGLSEGAGKVVVEEAPVEEEAEEAHVKVKEEAEVEEKPEENKLDTEEIFESDDEEDTVKSVEPEVEDEPVEENQTVDAASEVSGEEAVEEVVEEETAAEKVEEGNDEKESTVEDVVDEKVEEKSSKHHHKK